MVQISCHHRPLGALDSSRLFVHEPGPAGWSAAMSQCLLWWITREAQTWGRSHHIRAIAGTWAVRINRVAAALRSSNSTRSPLSGFFIAIDLLQLIILCAFLWLLYGCQVWLIRPIMSIDAGRTDRDKPCISPERLALQTEQVGLA